MEAKSSIERWDALCASSGPQEAMLRLERQLLDGSLPNLDLEAIPPELMQASPLLLAAFGRQLERRGRLVQAKHVLERAVKGLAGLAFRTRLLSAMGVLARTNQDLGFVEEARTFLCFLRDELRSGLDDADGHMLWALAHGAHLIGERDNASAYYESAFTKFEEAGERGGLNDAWFERLYASIASKEDGLREYHIERYRRFAQVDPEASYALRLVSAFEASANGRWPEARERLNLLEGADGFERPHRMRAAAEALTVRVSLRSGERSGEWIDRELGIVADRKDRDPALPCKFEWELALHSLYAANSRSDQASHCLTRIEALFGSGLAPAYRDMLAVHRSSSAATNGPDESGAIVPRGEPWRVEWFHGLRLSRKDREIREIPWKRKKAQELFLLLLTRPQYAASKEWAAEALFGDSDPKKTANQLYVTVHQLKKVLEEHLGIQQGIVIQGGSIRLQEQLIEYVDVEKYVTLARVGNQLWATDRGLSVELYEQAVHMYGEVLPELMYVEWLDRYREQLLDLQAVMFKRLGQHSLEQGDAERAALYYAEWASVQPAQEEAYQALLRVLMGMGRRAEAKDWYNKLERICMEELDAAPLEETKRIVTGWTG